MQPWTQAEVALWEEFEPTIKVWLRDPKPGRLDSDNPAIPAIESVFGTHAIVAKVFPRPMPAGGGGTTGVVVVLVSAPIMAFLTAIAAEAGKDAWRRLKQLVGDLQTAGQESARAEVSIDISDEGRIIRLPAGLPDYAYEEVMRRVATGEKLNLLWDDDARQWRDLSEGAVREP